MHVTGAKSSPKAPSQNLFNSHGGFLNDTTHHHRKNNITKLTPYDKTKKMAHDSQIVRAKENIQYIKSRHQLIDKSLIPR